MNKSSYIMVKNVYIHGVNNLYSASFEDGLNIIWGDMDTGKSSILNIIDYCLGGSNFHLSYGEITKYARTAFLEIDLNGNICTFERIINDQDSPVKVYNSNYNERHNHYPMLVSASSSINYPDGWISDFILDKLTITKIQIPESKLNPTTRLHRLSFRDLMKLMYLRQTKVGSESLLDSSNFAIFNKNIEIQKYVYNIHDDRLAEFQAELTRENSEKNKLENKLEIISNFLSSIQITGNIEDISNERISTLEEFEKIEKTEDDLKSNFRFSSEVSNELAIKITKAKAFIKDTVNDLETKEIKITNYLNLKKTYELDLHNLKTSKEIREHITLEELNPELSLNCPLCKTELHLSNPIILNDHIRLEINSINNRLHGVSHAIEALTKDKYILQHRLKEESSEIEKLTSILDAENHASLSPLVNNIQIIERQKSTITERLSDLSRSLLVKNKYHDIESKLEEKILLIEKIKKDIKDINDKMQGLDSVLSKLSDIFKEHLDNSGIQKNHGAYIDKKFTPHFRDISYYNTSSGGIRTILSILSYITRIHYLIENGGNLPIFFMLDTPGQNIGRGKRMDEEKAIGEMDLETSDPALYDKIYKQLLNIIKTAHENNSHCQIIVVDNDLPEFLTASEFHLVKRFSKSGGIHEIGLISNASNKT
ncbi:AAA family ATPase [Citrobacter sp. OP27]